MLDPLSSPAAYETFIYSLPEHYASINRSLLVISLRENTSDEQKG